MMNTNVGEMKKKERQIKKERKKRERKQRG